MDARFTSVDRRHGGLGAELVDLGFTRLIVVAAAMANSFYPRELGRR